jgi:hypothetical protein
VKTRDDEIANAHSSGPRICNLVVTSAFEPNDDSPNNAQPYSSKAVRERLILDAPVLEKEVALARASSASHTLSSTSAGFRARRKDEKSFKYVLVFLSAAPSCRLPNTPCSTGFEEEEEAAAWS